jgi:tetratricopeptide (TPR) repeat protein
MISGNILKGAGILVLLACILQPVLAAQPVLGANATARDNATDFYNLAEIAVSGGQFNQAVEYFDQALAANTTRLAMGDGLMYVYKDKAAALADLGQYDEAMKTADLGIIQFPNSSGLWNNKGYIYTKQGKFNDAADAYTHAVGLDKTYVKGWVNLGGALVQAGRYGDAVDAYNQALALDPGNADATAGLVQAKKGASPLSSPVVIAMGIIAILAVAGAVWYVKFRKPDEKKPGDKKAEGKKK